MTQDNEPRSITERLIVDDKLKPYQYERLVKFLRFHRPPSPSDPVDAIIIPTDSPSIDPVSFNMRIKAGIEYSQQFPETLIVFSGKRPDLSRANKEELQVDYSEAKVMANAAIALGLDGKRVLLEKQSLNAGENIANSLDLLRANDLRGLLIVCSSYMARRLDYYLKKEIKTRNLNGKLPTFIFDADVAEDLADPSQPLDERKHQRIIYESQRLFRYRRKGDL